MTNETSESPPERSHAAPGESAPVSPPSAPSGAAPPTFPLASEVRTYRRRENSAVTAIQLNLDVRTFTYYKWGALQSCKSGDWLVERDGSVYTVAAESFARTYKPIGPATYVKQGVVWAAPASCDGAIPTREGETHYQQGDFLVWNDKERKDGYAIKKDVFDSLYEPDPQPEPNAQTG